MKHIKKALTLLMALAFVWALLPGIALTARADTAPVVKSGTEGSLTWKIFQRSDGTCHLEFTGNGRIENQPAGWDVRPAWLDETYRSKITSLAVADGVTYIGDNAFWCYRDGGLHNCTSLYLAEGITHIGKHALCDAAGVSYLRLPSTVTSIGDSAFDHIKSQYYTLPASLREVGDYSGQNPIVGLENRYYPGSEADYLKIKFEALGASDYTSSTYYSKIRFGSVDPLYNNAEYTSYTPWIEAGSTPPAPDDQPVVPPVTPAPTGRITSDWAAPEVARADSMGLIPDSLKNTDLRQRINRAEFAAVAVKTYESLSGTAATPASGRPFTDTSDTEVLKAYNNETVNGLGGGLYGPYNPVTREQCAAMLTRVHKKLTMPGWTLANDTQFPLNFHWPALFADDSQISSYARESVYFMVANNIIMGMGDNTFAPGSGTTAGEAVGFATREQALIIALRMVDNLK